MLMTFHTMILSSDSISPFGAHYISSLDAFVSSVEGNMYSS